MLIAILFPIWLKTDGHISSWFTARLRIETSNFIMLPAVSDDFVRIVRYVWFFLGGTLMLTFQPIVTRKFSLLNLLVAWEVWSMFRTTTRGTYLWTRVIVQILCESCNWAASKNRDGNTLWSSAFLKIRFLQFSKKRDATRHYCWHVDLVFCPQLHRFELNENCPESFQPDWEEIPHNVIWKLRRRE